MKKMHAAVIGIACTVAAISLSATASAAPLDGPLIETTCSYEQLTAALQVQAPQASARLADSPDAQARLRDLIALPVDQRRQRIQGFLDRNPDVRAMIDDKRNTPEGQQKMQMAAQVANTCHDY
ncbi:hemophore-related protein [Mycolicibacterium moriokaense]|nr:hemophore-related protein [Mycolicibacterium moriokaense]